MEMAAYVPAMQNAAQQEVRKEVNAENEVASMRDEKENAGDAECARVQAVRKCYEAIAAQRQMLSQSGMCKEKGIQWQAAEVKEARREFIPKLRNRE